MTELKILSAGAVKRGVSRMAEAYGREHGVRVTVEFATAPELRRRMAAGEPADVLIAPPPVIDAAAEQRRIVPESRAFVGRSRMGIVVHRDAAVQTPESVDEFERMLVSASEVVHNQASSGLYAAQLLQRLGLRERLESRVIVVGSGAAVMEYVADRPPGVVGLAQISEIRVLIEKGCAVRFAAPLPDEIQHVTEYEAAAVAGGTLPAAQELARYFATADAKVVFAATGID